MGEHTPHVTSLVRFGEALATTQAFGTTSIAEATRTFFRGLHGAAPTCPLALPELDPVATFRRLHHYRDSSFDICFRTSGRPIFHGAHEPPSHGILERASKKKHGDSSKNRELSLTR